MAGKCISGLVKRHPDGFGFLIPDDSDVPDLYLSRRQMRGVMSNDRVRARVAIKRRGGTRYFGKDVEILKRGVFRVVGELQKVPGSKSQGGVNQDFWDLKDSRKKWGFPFKMTWKNIQGAYVGAWVAVDITEYPGKNEFFRGKVVEVIGEDCAQNDVKKVLLAQQVEEVFPDEVLHEAQAVSSEVKKTDLSVERKDLRKIPFCTIDGSTAKDFDDAIYVEKQSKKEGFRLWVAIADVSHYVPVESALDKEAQSRGTSIYFPGAVVPMLPETLSNGICSLQPQVDRLALVCQVDVNERGELSSTSIYEAVIRSQARLTYGQAQEIIDGLGLSSMDSPVVESLGQAAELAQILMDRRYERGSLSLEMTETQVIMDERGEVEDVVRTHRLFAHQLIEEMMLVANVAVAQIIEKNQTPGLYRVHESPHRSDLEYVQSFLDQSGASIDLFKGDLHKNLNKTFQHFKNTPKSLILNLLTLRSLSQAVYSSENKGHFGLNFPLYTHFTSPIRRYPDLIVHRILKKLKTSSKSGFFYSKDKLQTLGSVLSGCEQKAVKMERQVVAIKKARFLKKKLETENLFGHSFPGIISGVTKFGIFVLIHTYDIDGLVKVEDLGSDFFEFNESLLTLTGRRTGKIYKMGDPLNVGIAAVNTQEGKVDLVLKDKLSP